MSNVGPVRMGRFEWDRLMIMGGLPKEDRFKLLAVGLFMDLSGKGSLPSPAELAEFGLREAAWENLLRRAVDAGWLTVIDTSVYAASVPREVWERRKGTLGAPPFRSPNAQLGRTEASG